MPPDPTTSLELLLSEAKRTIDAQARLAEGLDEKAVHLMRFEAVILGLVVTGLTLAGGGRVIDDAPRGILISVLVGLLGLLVSLVSAVLALRSKELRSGLRAESIVEATGILPDEDILLRESLLAYGVGVLENARALDRSTHRLEAALWFLGNRSCLPGAIAEAGVVLSMGWLHANGSKQ